MSPVLRLVLIFSTTIFPNFRTAIANSDQANNNYGGDAGTGSQPPGGPCNNCNICPSTCNSPPTDPYSAAIPPPPPLDQSKCPPAAPVVCCGGGANGGGGGVVGQGYGPPPPFYYPYNDSSAAGVGLDSHSRRAGFVSVHVACAVLLCLSYVWAVIV